MKRFSITLALLVLASGLFSQQKKVRAIHGVSKNSFVDTVPMRFSMEVLLPGSVGLQGGIIEEVGTVLPSVSWENGLRAYRDDWWDGVYYGQKDTTWIDTCVTQLWRIQIGLNQFALKDTTYCFKYPVVNGGGSVITDTIWITNNVFYQGKQGIPGPTGPQGPQGPRGATGDCSNCPGGGGGGGFLEEGWVNVVDFGAVPNDGQPDDAAFRSAIDAARQSGYRKVYIPAGVFNITYVNFPTHFGRWIVQGEGIADGGEAVEKFTQIKCANTSGPCMDFTAVRLMKLRNISFEGNQGEFVASVVGKSTDTLVWRPENWVKPGNSMDKYRAQSAISWDYNQSTPPWSAQVVVENVKITGFVVGINISPSAGNMQADTYWFRDVKLENCTWGAAINQDQCRSITFENVWMNQMYCAYTNNRFGRGNGSAFNITGGQYTSIFRLFECTNAYRGQMSVNGMFAEACGIIGSINGLGINTNSMAFTGCEFGLDDDGWVNPRPGVWVTPFAVMSIGGNAVFTGCNIHSKKKTIAFGGNQYQFIGTTFTETRPVFPNDMPTVSITGRPLFDYNTAITDMVDIVGGQKKYVRYGTKFIQKRSQQPPYMSVVNASNYIPAWMSFVWQPLPNSSAKQFEWSIPSNEAKKYRVGDYIDCQAKANVVPGLGTDFGQSMIPGLEVVEVKSASLVLRRISPEMRVENWYNSGAVYTEPYIFAAGSAIVAKAAGASVEVENASLLQEGDFVSDSKQNAVRVISKAGNVVTFSSAISEGRLVGI